MTRSSSRDSLTAGDLLPDRRLFQAVLDNDVDAVRYLAPRAFQWDPGVAKSKWVTFMDSQQRNYEGPMLAHAIKHAEKESHERPVLRALLEAGFDPEVRCSHGLMQRGTPILLAAAQGDLPSMKVLQEHGASSQATCASGFNLLGHVSVTRGNQPFLLDGVAFCLDAFRVDSSQGFPPHGETILHFAHDTTGDLVRMLADHGHDLDQRDAHGRTALISQASEVEPSFDQRPVIRAMIECGADPHAKSQDGQTAVSAARSYGNDALANWMEDLIQSIGAQEQLMEVNPMSSEGQAKGNPVAGPGSI